ncbi:MAG: DUF4843 domain-containing protein [Prevotella sp.]|nr:DUF4843 domain-containing protein [Prevotella sp.]MBQ9224274.1 DUF4843 domain-containing protein [Prevotella sp.]
MITNIFNHIRIKAKMMGVCTCLLPITACFLTACSSTDEDFYYQDEPRVRLVGDYVWAAGTDSISFSFVSYSSDVTEMTMLVDAQIMGEVAERDRVVNLSVDAAKTTADASMYTVPATVTVPAGEVKATFPVVLKRAASLTSKKVRLYIKVEDSNDFKTGVNEENHITMIWSDVLTKPNNWSDLEPFFGTYSDTKYRFMLTNSGGAGEFNTETMSWALLNSYRIRFQNALNEYNAAHPGNPLTDENGQLVTFE